MSKWTNEEIKILKDAYSKVDGKQITDITKELSIKLNKSVGAIRNKAYSLKITHREKYYTEAEINFLKTNYNKLSYNDMAEILKKDESNICRKLKELGLNKTKRIANTINIKNKHIYTDEERKKISNNMKKYIAENGHPKGYLGKKHNQETLNKISQASKNKWQVMTKRELEKRRLKQRITKIKNGILNPMINQNNPYSRTKSGKRKDLNNIFFRSAWEANIARYFDFIGVKWEFEPKTFIFHTIKRGCVSYLPDFYLPEEDKWIEVKGWMDAKSKTKLNRFKKYYPEEYKKLEIIDSKKYEEIKKKVAPFIKEWE